MNFICKEKILLNEYLVKASSLTFDGEYFYSCDKTHPIIYKVCTCGELKGYIKTDTHYKSITYDCKEGCYWAIGIDNKDIIYKLNRSFDKIGELFLYTIRRISLKSVYYDCISNNLLVYTKRFIFIVSKIGEVILTHKNDVGLGSKFGCILGINKLICYSSSNLNEETIGICDIGFLELGKFQLPEGYCSNGIVALFDCDTVPNIFILSVYNKYEPYLLRYICE